MEAKRALHEHECGTDEVRRKQQAAKMVLQCTENQIRHAAANIERIRRELGLL